MRETACLQIAQKVLKNAKTACSRLGQYRMPFAWAARSVAFKMLNKTPTIPSFKREQETSSNKSK